jgi:Protein of unknown function (DUF2971)
MPLTPEHKKHASIFHPYLLDEMERIDRENRRFVYYTSADTAFKILTSKKIWLRQTTLMNDSREILHGLDCVRVASRSDHGQRLLGFVDSIYPGVGTEIAREFEFKSLVLQNRTFVACLSVHGDAAEDQHGRLSMWRAYGRGTGVAIVVSAKPIFSTSTALGAYTSPVAYMDAMQMAEQFRRLADQVEQNREYLEQLQRQGTKEALLIAFQSAAVCTKHPGFHEEQEWRIVAMPELLQPKRLGSIYPTVGGVPQQVLTLSLEDVPEEGLTGISPPDFIDRIIIGPTDSAAAIYDALYRSMLDAKIADPLSKLHVSNIPLRSAPNG